MGEEAKRVALDVMGWMWGTVQGAFNEKMNVSQIIVDAVIGMIPLVGDVTAVRDLIAISLGLASDEKKREETMQWVLLVVFIFALIPVVGGVIKGVGRLAIHATAEAVKDSAALMKIGESVVEFLNRIGHGNGVKYLKELDVLKYEKQVLAKFHEFMQGFIDTLAQVKDKMSSVLPAKFVTTIDGWRTSLIELKKLGDSKIPMGIKELNASLKRLQQLVYKGEWTSVSRGSTNGTLEAEARLIDASHVAATASAHGGLKGNKALADGTAKAEAEIAKVYTPKAGYADLKGSPYVSSSGKPAYYEKIEAFSGTIKASKAVEGEYLLRIHRPGEFARPWWVRLPKGVTEANWREFMQNGKQWREVLAVLDEFGKNGAYSIVKVKAGHTLNAWEGKAAEQFGQANPGQYLPGGAMQLFIDSRSKAFTEALEWIVTDAKTLWKDLDNVGYAATNIKYAGAARVERLTDKEEQSKRSAARQTAGAH
jgi:hypothetical protein